MNKNSPLMTSEDIIDAASKLYGSMHDSDKYSTGEVVMILDAAKMMMIQTQTIDIIKDTVQ